MSVRSPVVLVGVSGSRASRAALRWAADEAIRRHASLHVVRAFEQPALAYYAHPAAAAVGPERAEELARRDLAATVRAVLGPRPRPGTTTEVVEGIAERILVDKSADADLLVLGSASGAGAGHPIGPVVRACLYQAQCPVVAVSTKDPGCAPAALDDPDQVRAGSRPALDVLARASAAAPG